MAVNDGGFFADNEQKEFRNCAADDIERYLYFLGILEKWYDEINEPFPLPCRTNYRDAWFHYKKLYEQKDYIKVVQEQYALEEHLIRSSKDAINRYFQIYVMYMEEVYHHLLSGRYVSSQEEKNALDDIIVKYNLSVDIKEKWALRLYNELEKYNLEMYYCSLVKYIYYRNMNYSDVLRVLQKSIHSIKNYCAKLRINGTNIYRPIDGNEYMDECIEIYENLILSLESIYIKECLWVLGGCGDGN